MCEALPPDITPESHPDHWVVGHNFVFGINGTVWYCFSHDAGGYNMRGWHDISDVKSISERAIGRTFHVIHDDGFTGLLMANGTHRVR